MKKRFFSIILVIVMIMGIFPLGAIAVEDSTTVDDVLEMISGTYSASAKWAGDYSTQEIFAYVTLSKDEYSIETIKSDSESKQAVKSIIDHSGSRRWSTTTFDAYGEPIYAEDPNLTEIKTIDDFLNTPIALTSSDKDEIFAGGTVKIPAGSYYVDVYTFYDIQDKKTQKLYLGNDNIELTRIETEPFILSDILDKVGGNYILYNFESGRTVTITIKEDEYCLEEVASGYAQRIICDNTGTKAWSTFKIEQGHPVFNTEPDDDDKDATINLFLNSEVEIIIKEISLENGVLIPARSYSVNTNTILGNLIFFDKNEQSGKMQKLYTSTANTVLIRIGGADEEHKHTYGETTYIWHDGLSQCTAYHTCTDATCGHTELETVDTITGDTEITATFTKEEFAEQSKLLADVTPQFYVSCYTENGQCLMVGVPEENNEVLNLTVPYTVYQDMENAKLFTVNDNFVPLNPERTIAK